MKRTYSITGMTCDSCQLKVQNLLAKVEAVKNVSIDLKTGKAEIEMESLVSTGILIEALKNYPKYVLSESPHPGDITVDSAIAVDDPDDPAGKSWVAVYKPILLVFGYIAVVSVIAAKTAGYFSIMTAMRVFMAGFFLTFSFFKMLDLKNFADSYVMYDWVAGKFRGWGYWYAFIELVLGISYALNFHALITNMVTLAVMTISIPGVLETVMKKRKIKCACLGTVFNLPMSTVTVIEDALMIVMSAIMLSIIHS